MLWAENQLNFSFKCSSQIDISPAMDDITPTRPTIPLGRPIMSSRAVGINTSAPFFTTSTTRAGLLLTTFVASCFRERELLLLPGLLLYWFSLFLSGWKLCCRDRNCFMHSQQSVKQCLILQNLAKLPNSARAVDGCHLHANESRTGLQCLSNFDNAWPGFLSKMAQYYT